MVFYLNPAWQSQALPILFYFYSTLQQLAWDVYVASQHAHALSED